MPVDGRAAHYAHQALVFGTVRSATRKAGQQCLGSIPRQARSIGSLEHRCPHLCTLLTICRYQKINYTHKSCFFFFNGSNYNSICLAPTEHANLLRHWVSPDVGDELIVERRQTTVVIGGLGAVS